MVTVQPAWLGRSARRRRLGWQLCGIRVVLALLGVCLVNRRRKLGQPHTACADHAGHLVEAWSRVRGRRVWHRHRRSRRRVCIGGCFGSGNAGLGGRLGVFGCLGVLDRADGLRRRRVWYGDLDRVGGLGGLGQCGLGGLGHCGLGGLGQCGLGGLGQCGLGGLGPCGLGGLGDRRRRSLLDRLRRGVRHRRHFRVRHTHRLLGLDHRRRLRLDRKVVTHLGCGERRDAADHARACRDGEHLGVRRLFGGCERRGSRLRVRHAAALLLEHFLLLEHLLAVSLALLVLLLDRGMLQLAHREAEQVAVWREPWMCHDLVQRRTLRRVWHEHACKQRARLWADIVRKRQRRRHNVLVQHIDVVAVRVRGIVVKRQVAGEHRVQDHTARPHVDGRTDIQPVLYDELGRRVAGRATARRHEVVAARAKVVGEAKVGDDDVAVAIQQEVLELQVTVDDVLLMQVGDAADELRKEAAGVALL